MRYYYVLSLNGVRKVGDISPTIKNYVDMKGFSCLNNKYITSLVTRLNLPFAEILRDVFIYFLEVEYMIALKLTTSPKLKHPTLTGRFGEHYYTLIKEFKNSDLEEKCNLISKMYEESINFFYSSKDAFLSKFSRIENILDYKILKNYSEDTDQETIVLKQNTKINYSHLVILLDSEKRYIGYTSIRSWLSLDNLYKGHLYTLGIGNIKTSLANLLFNKEKNIKNSFISAISKWAKQHCWESLQVSYTLTNVGSLACSEENIVEISEKTDLFSSYISSVDFYSWIRIKLEQCESLFEDTWLSYNIFKNICVLFLISYPDRKPCKEEIEWIYISTFRGNTIGYCVVCNPSLIKSVSSIEDYFLVKEYINNSPPSLDKDESLIYLHKINTSKFQIELDTKISYLSILELQVVKIYQELRDCCSDATYAKIRREVDRMIDRRLDTFQSSISFIKIIGEKEDLINKMLLHSYITALHNVVKIKLEFNQFVNWYKILTLVEELKLNYNKEYIIDKVTILKQYFIQLCLIIEEPFEFLARNSLTCHAENIAHILRLEI